MHCNLTTLLAFKSDTKLGDINFQSKNCHALTSLGYTQLSPKYASRQDFSNFVVANKDLAFTSRFIVYLLWFLSFCQSAGSELLFPNSSRLPFLAMVALGTTVPHHSNDAMVNFYAVFKTNRWALGPRGSGLAAKMPCLHKYLLFSSSYH